MVLVANKWDLKNENSVSEDKIDQVAKNMNVMLLQTNFSIICFFKFVSFVVQMGSISILTLVSILTNFIFRFQW